MPGSFLVRSDFHRTTILPANVHVLMRRRSGRYLHDQPGALHMHPVTPLATAASHTLPICGTAHPLAAEAYHDSPLAAPEVAMQFPPVPPSTTPRRPAVHTRSHNTAMDQPRFKQERIPSSTRPSQPCRACPYFQAHPAVTLGKHCAAAQIHSLAATAAGDVLAQL